MGCSVVLEEYRILSIVLGGQPELQLSHVRDYSGVLHILKAIGFDFFPYLRKKTKIQTNPRPISNIKAIRHTVHSCASLLGTDVG